MPSWPVAHLPALRAAQAVASGAAKAALPAGTTFVLGVVAGAFIGFGSFLALSVGGACPGLASANPGLQKMVLVRARWPGRCSVGLQLCGCSCPSAARAACVLQAPGASSD
jgi:hypothetical protein